VAEKVSFCNSRFLLSDHKRTKVAFFLDECFRAPGKTKLAEQRPLFINKSLPLGVKFDPRGEVGAQEENFDT
jgi:hypothetical protein